MAGRSQELDDAMCADAARSCACFNFRKAARAVTQLFDAVLEPSGLRSTQFVVIVAIHVDKTPALPDLARALGVDRSTLTRNLKPLERDGLVQRFTAKQSRATLARLTPKGRRLLASTLPRWREAQDRFVGQFGSQRWNAMLGDLAQVVGAAQDA